MDKKHKGAHNELLATVWLLKNGYEVFRNVSSHGQVDIIALKDGETILLDVKQSNVRTDGTFGVIYLKSKQVELGVKLLCVTDDGDCKILSSPESRIRNRLKCDYCGGIFVNRKDAQRFCSNKCRSSEKNDFLRDELIKSRKAEKR